MTTRFKLKFYCGMLWRILGTQYAIWQPDHDSASHTWDGAAFTRFDWPEDAVFAAVQYWRPEDV